MATWMRTRFRNISDMIDWLNGAVISPINLSSGLGVDGLTLIINVGGAGDRLVTFTAIGRPWTAAEILAKIVAAHVDLAAVAKLEVKEARPDLQSGAPTYLKLVGAGSVITVRSTGTANALFGFATGASPANDTVGVPYTSSEVQKMQPKGDSQGIWDVITYK